MQLLVDLNKEGRNHYHGNALEPEIAAMPNVRLSFGMGSFRRGTQLGKERN